MEIKILSDAHLRDQTRECAKREKRETAFLIEHLIEIEARKLYLKWGHGSLFAYLTDELGYEKGAASLRVSAVRASDSVPDLGKKIESGELSLKTIRTLESFSFHESRARGKKFTRKEKRAMYKNMTGLSHRLVETRLAEIATSKKFHAPQRELDRALKGGVRVIQFTVTEEEYALVQRFRELMSHQLPGASNGDLYKMAVEKLVKQRDPKQKAERAKVDPAHPVGETHQLTLAAHYLPSRYIPSKENHALWKSYDSQGCAYVDAESGKRCGSKHRLERDHIHPFALGGANTQENLQILCASHHQYKTKLEFGSL